MLPAADHPNYDTIEDLLVETLDTAAADPVRLRFMLRLYMLSHDLDRAADLDRQRYQGAPPVYLSW